MKEHKDRTRGPASRHSTARRDEQEERHELDTPEFRPGHYSNRNRSATGRGYDGPYGTRTFHDDDLAQIGGSIGYGARGQSGYGEAEPRYPGPDAFRSGSFGDLPHAHGPHRGKGPRNYQRTDARLLEDICERLTHDHLIDASELEIECTDGTVGLRGRLPERWMKHYVEDLVDACPGVRDIDNRITIARHGPPPDAATTGVTASTDRSAGGSAAKRAAPVAPPAKGRR